MLARRPRSEIGKNALAVLSDKVNWAVETGKLEDAYLAKGIIMGLDLADMLRPGSPDAFTAKKHQDNLEALIAKLEQA